MRYVGGKSKITAHIARTILSTTDRRDLYLEPFVGGGSMLAKMAPHFRRSFAGDAHEDLILMWDAIRNGWEPPAVTYERYQELRYDPTPSAERGFAGFGGSFGGRWFGGFARGGFNADGTPRNHQAESGRTVLKIRDAIAGSDVTFQHRDYHNWLTDCDQPHVIYCDPPYAGSSHVYKPGAFNTEEFWEQAREWSERGHSVFVSEYVAPDGWIPVWEGAKRQSLVVGSSPRDIRTERLFMWNTPETTGGE